MKENVSTGPPRPIRQLGREFTRWTALYGMAARPLHTILWAPPLAILWFYGSLPYYSKGLVI